MRCRPYNDFPYLGEVGESIRKFVTVRSVRWIQKNKYRQSGQVFVSKALQVAFVDSVGRIIVTTYTGKKDNIRGLKFGDCIEIEGIVRSHDKKNDNYITTISHIKSI